MKKPSNQELEKILIAKFYECFPNGVTSPWIRDYLNFYYSINKEKNALCLAVYLNKLEEDTDIYYETRKDGSQVFVKIDESKGEKSIVISYENYTPMCIFKAFLFKDLSIEIAHKYKTINSLEKNNFIKNESDATHK